MNSMVYFLTVLEVFNKGVLSRTVDITGSTTGFQGTNSTSLECVFTKDNGDLLTAVIFQARNSSNKFEPIVSFSVRRGHTFFSLWSYLFENVTQELTPVTDSSTAAEIQINNLLCKHEREYKCEVAFESLLGQAVPVDSNIINIRVQVRPSKPESIELLGKLDDNRILSTTVYPASRPTMNIEKNEIFTTTIVPTQLNNLNELVSITEGDNVKFSCSGNVGKPPVCFKWEKIQSGGAITTYNDTNTDIIYHSENCSFHRTSNITLQMFAEDNNAIVRCVVAESVISDDKLYAETDPIEVLYKVRLPNITKHPDQEIYGKETKSITLTCNSDGNPKPSYVWSKNGNILHNGSVMIISNVTVEDSGTYTCNVSNYVENDQIMYSTSVSIVIVEEIVTTTTRRTTYLWSTPGRVVVRAPDNDTDTNVYTIVGVVIAAVVIVVVAIVVVCKYNQRRSKQRRKTNECLHNYVNNAANLSSTHYDDLGVMREESHYDELKHNRHLYTNISPQ